MKKTITLFLLLVSAIMHGQAPSLATIPNQTTCDGQSINNIQLNLSGGTSGVTYSFISSNASITPSITFGGTATMPTFTIATISGQIGATSITITASNSLGSDSESFQLALGNVTQGVPVLGAETVVISPFNNLSSVAFGPDGNLYTTVGNVPGAPYTQGSIAQFSPTGTLLNANYITGLTQPGRLKVGKDGKFYFINNSQTNLTRYNGQTLEATKINAAVSVFGVNTNAAGEVFYLNFAGGGGVLKLPANFTNASTITNLYTTNPNPGYMVIDPTDTFLYYIDESGLNTSKLIRLNADGSGGSTLILQTPQMRGLAYDESGQLWISHGSTGKLSKVDAVTGVVTDVITSGFYFIPVFKNGEIFYRNASGSTAGVYKRTVTTPTTYTPCNNPPTIEAIANQSTCQNTPKQVSFTVSDVEMNTVTVTATSSNQTLVPNANLAVSGNVLTITPANNQVGSAVITLTPNDGTVNGTPVTFTFTVNANPVVASSQTNVSCNGGSNGMASVIASNGTAPYSYLWSNNATTASISGVTAGSYSVIVTDAIGCTATASFTISEPTILMATIVSQTNVSCNGGTNGAATLMATGGTQPYTYLWSNGAETATNSNLSAATYNVTITDANGCAATQSVTITEPVSINVSTDITACGSYNWSVTGMTYTQSGIYTGTTTNGEGCTVNQTLNLTVLTQITYYADADNDGFGNPAISVQSCTGAPMGYVTLGTDCNDNNAAINPAAIDICLDGIDNDCNGIIDNVGLPGGCVPTLTTLPSAQCGATINNLSVTINATYIIGAQGYRFRVTNMVTNAVNIVDRPVNSFALSSLTGITLGTPYQVEVALKFNNVWQPFYGAACSLNTPNPLATIGVQCGTTLTDMNQFVYATYVSSVTGYRFRVTNLSTNAVQVYEALSGQNRFTFNQLSAAIRAYSTTYAVEVALRNTDGSYLPYGTACNISTPAFPTSEIVLAQCDTVATSNTQTFNAVIVSGATAYRFQLTNSGLGYSFSIDRPLSNYSLSLFPGLVAGTTYTVRVAVRIGGVWGPLTGKSCNITTPGTAPEIQRVVVDTNDFAAITYPNPFAESFMFDVKTTNESTVQVRVYDMLGKQVENRTVEASEINNIQIGSSFPSGVYNVIVSQGENTQTLRVIKR